ncbi:hypothetical protein Y032_0150g2736 [Ancylostoma ceylanicum]|uniref:Uncharacterized protein n=1 Tax=Ancylostoma ceylanicum TaxID=53326 RepID=A0A016T106_9BILA|nr:hypothetical protein Y032_0150g2736 [Ancylostoma ceylanicum]
MHFKVHYTPTNRICDLLTQDDVDGPPFILGDMPTVLMIYNDTDEESLDIACVLKAVVPNFAAVRIIDKPCMQLLTIDAVPEEIHVIVTRGDYNRPFCDAQVYGAIPSVIEVRITTSKKVQLEKFVTFNMITNGGHLRFDLETTGINAGRNMLIAFRTLMSIAISGRPYQNGFPNFHRESHLRSKPELGRQKDIFLRKLDVCEKLHFLAGSTQKILLHHIDACASNA